MHESHPHTVDYIEMPSRDLQETRLFFSTLFGWSFQDYGPDYIAFDDGRMTGGFFKADRTWDDVVNCPLIVFYASELEKTRTDVERLGGQVTRDVFDFPGGRRFHFEAPGSGEFAVWSEK